MRRNSLFLVFIALMPLIPLQCLAAPEGVPRELARERAANISDVRYRLSFKLRAHAPTTPAHEELRFSLHTLKPVLLDYRDGEVLSVSVNGQTVPVKTDNGHLELSADKLRAGPNVVVIEFASNIAPAGKPITRYEDKDDGSEYIYTLFVPMDASMAFPCFDQPDLKGAFTLTLAAPADWTVVSNTNVDRSEPGDAGLTVSHFQETHPISTYVFAFAAGPFRKVHETPGLPGLYVRKSKVQRAESEAPELQQTTADGMRYLANFFAQPFPFPKYDMVLIPGLAYGGMEHAGATFLNEESVLFRTAPTHTDVLNRDLLLLHELTHQWFGDFTTMRWFDDLWLKEGFAEYMAYQTLASLRPNDNVWKLFYEQTKPAAYAIDATKGTTPIYQEIPNLKDAKSAYGAIVYSKAPGVLKQLAFVLGPENFQNGLRIYLHQHPYGNAEWSDLVRAFETTSRRSLSNWADMWIRHRGMPQVDVHWSCTNGRVSSFGLTQKDVLGEGGVWPVATQVRLSYGDAPPALLRVELKSASEEVPQATGKPCPEYVFANDEDYAYGRFLLDATSEPVVMQDIGGVTDLFRATLLWGSLWEAVRVTELAPAAYVSLAQKQLPNYSDESLTQNIITRTATALHRYMSDSARAPFVPGLEKLATAEMMSAPEQGLRIIWFRGLRTFAETPEGLAELQALLQGKMTIPGVELRPLDRWNMVTTLIALADPQADSLFKAEQQRDHTGDGLKYAYIAEAARPDARTKQKYFDDYLHNAARPEDWVERSLGAFNYWNQSELTEPYLKPALEALPQIKRDRKIFFLVRWLNAFIVGQHSAAAARQVHAFLDNATLDKDVRLKILQELDELDRAVAIRAKYD